MHVPGRGLGTALRALGGDGITWSGSATRFLRQAAAWGAIDVLPAIAGRIPLSDQLRSAGATYEHALTELVCAAQNSGQLRPDIGAGDLPLLLASLRRHPLDQHHADLPARHLAVLLDGLRQHPDNTTLPGQPFTTSDVTASTSTPKPDLDRDVATRVAMDSAQVACPIPKPLVFWPP